MKKIITSIALCLSAGLFAQTAGTLTCTITEAVSGQTKNVYAIWIENNTGTFEETKFRFVSGGTSDHLPTWTSKSSAGAATSATSASCSVTSATTGSTRTATTTPTAFGAKTVTWNGTNAAGTLLPDGIYKVWIESAWSSNTAGGQHGTISSYSFTKGPSPDHQTPAGATITGATFSAITLDWLPQSGVGVNEISNENPDINVFPNPSNGIFNVTLFDVNSIRVMNSIGAIVYNEKVERAATSTTVDLSNFANGIYFISVSNEKGTSSRKVILEK